MIIDSSELKRRYLLRIEGARERQVYIGPQIVALEISNACSVNCQYCSSNRSPDNPHHSRKGLFLPWKRFLTVIRDCVGLHVDEIHLTGAGEPTTHPLFRNMMRHLEQQPLTVSLFTNGTFPLDYCEDVIKGDCVVIDMSALNRRQYRELQGQDLFDRVAQNIERLVYLRDTVKPGFRIEMAYILNAVNINQKRKIRKMAAQLGINVSVRPIHL